MKIAIVFGTRPEIIKLAPLYLKAKEMGVNAQFICTGQHREMVDMMKGIFGIEADYDMNVMVQNQTPNMVAAKVIYQFETYAKDEAFNWVLIQGDTTTAMAAAIAAFNMGLKVGHVEAGLRSGNLYDPFPEEMNRRVIDQVSELLFAPTEKAVNQLLSEGFTRERIRLTGNTVIDAQYYVMAHFDLDKIRRSIAGDGDYFLVTLHRRENIGPRMKNILRAMRRFAEREKIGIVFPVHKNPKVRDIVYNELGDCRYSKLIEPVDYVTLTALLQGARFVATDSGGIQEEAPTFRKFVVVCRETTERPELIEHGFGVLAGTTEESVFENLNRALHVEVPNKPNPFGDGKASERILKNLLNVGE